MPSVSVIMPVYNGGDFVAPAVYSILSQTLTDFELIISDDGSTDGCLDFCRHLNDHRIKLLVSSTNTGASEARNRALEVAQAPLVALADADDLADPLRLERQRNFMDQHKTVSLVAGATRVFGQQPVD